VTASSTDATSDEINDAPKLFPEKETRLSNKYNDKVVEITEATVPSAVLFERAEIHLKRPNLEPIMEAIESPTPNIATPHEYIVALSA
jgi:hypothetical protein